MQSNQIEPQDTLPEGQRPSDTQVNNAASSAPEPTGIVSVNSRGGTSNNMAGKVIFVVAVVAVVVVGGLMAFNKWRANKKATEVATATATRQEKAAANKPAAVGQRRTFDETPPPLPKGAQAQTETAAIGAAPAPGTTAAPGQTPLCDDGTIGTVMIGPDGKPMATPTGAPMRVCKGGQVLVPAVIAPGTGMTQNPGINANHVASTGGTPGNSRYGGDVIVGAASPGASSMGGPGGTSNPNDPMTTLAMLQAMMKPKESSPTTPMSFSSGFRGKTSSASGGDDDSGSGAAAGSPSGSIGTMLTPSQTPAISASMLGDRNMILPKGRTIDCGMSMRLINEVAGMASCVLSQNVYSDNGRVVLLERGSEATGEYAAAMAQGQRRLFVLWTRIKTPNGVVINLNSPSADGLGTSGLDGYVDNHWWERIGAAFLLSFVQDAIAYEVNKSSGGNSPTGQQTVLLQNTTQTGNRMAEKVLESTINIKPTLYKNQGDRGSIYVARDLDFGSVYALRAR